MKSKLDPKIGNKLRNLVKPDEDTGKYMNAQKVGRNILIGILIIVAGVLYALGGLNLLIFGIISLIVFLVALSIVLYIMAKIEVF